MTTAHRPTWKPAVGRSDTGGWTAGGAASGRTATLDLPAHQKLKFRTEHVDRKKAVRDSIKKLQQAESAAVKKQLGRLPVNAAIEQEGRQKLLKQSADVDEERIRSKYNDDDEEGGGEEEEEGWSDLDGDDSDLSDDDDSDSDGDEDDEAALQAELAKIRAEREAVKMKEQQDLEKKQEEEMEEVALLGNPLLAGGAQTGKLKRKWNDDVVFRNQAKDEPEVKKRFINDTIRNDFHKRFLNKFIR